MKAVCSLRPAQRPRLAADMDKVWPPRESSLKATALQTFSLYHFFIHLFIFKSFYVRM